MGLCVQSLVRVRHSPSLSESSTQVRPCQASMHPTKSLPPSRPQQPLSRQPRPPAPQGNRHLLGRSRAQEATWQLPSPTLASDALSPQQATQQGASTGWSPNVRSHWRPGFARKNLSALRAAPFVEGTGCYQSLLTPKEQLPFSCLFACLLSRRKQTLAEPCPVWVWLYA